MSHRERQWPPAHCSPIGCMLCVPPHLTSLQTVGRRPCPEECGGDYPDLGSGLEATPPLCCVLRTGALIWSEAGWECSWEGSSRGTSPKGPGLLFQEISPCYESSGFHAHSGFLRKVVWPACHLSRHLSSRPMACAR